MKQSYYVANARILPDWHLPHGGHRVKAGELETIAGPRRADAGLWADPPHVALANLGYNSTSRGGFATEKEIVSFTKRYGALGTKPEEMAEPGDPLWVSFETFHALQGQLRKAWEKRDHRLFVDPNMLKAGTGYEHLMHVNWEIEDGALVMRVASWYDYVSILLAQDIAASRARICRNPNCLTPYFTAERRDMIYCSHPCAVAVNVRKFRTRQGRKKR